MRSSRGWAQTDHNEISLAWLVSSEYMQFTCPIISSCDENLPCAHSYLPHNAEYFTLMITSVGSTILGMGRSSSFTSNFPLKTTAFIVVFDMVLFGLFGIASSKLL